MRVVFAIPDNLAAFTGGYCYARRLIEWLPKLGIETIHLRLSPAFPNVDSSVVENAVRAINGALQPGSVVLIDGLAFGVFADAAASSLKAPIVALCHHPLGLEAGHAAERSQALLRSEKAALFHAARVIVPSAYIARTLEQDFKVDPSRICIAAPGTDPAPRAKGSSGPVSLLAVGALTPRKAFDVLIEALAGVTHLGWRLRIAGGHHHSPETAGALMGLIEAKGLAGRIACAGELEGAALGDAFHESDVFVSSSLYEGYGMALAEAMMRGLPIVMGKGGAAAETVPDAAALKAPPGDVLALREALRLIIEDVGLRRRLADASWRAGQALPSWRDTAEACACAIGEAALYAGKAAKRKGGL